MDPIDNALRQYRTIHAYQATLRSFRGNDGELIRYSFRQPGLIRMEFIHPHKGAMLIYDPEQSCIYLWPLGSRILPPLILSPDNPMIQSPSGQRVDRSDVGSLLENIHALQQGGETSILEEDSIEVRDAMHVAIHGNAAVSCSRIHGYEVWLDRRTAFPVKVSSFDANDNLLETVALEEIEIDPVFPNRFFTP